MIAQLKDTPSEAAYDLWATGYDTEPGNLILTLHEQIFAPSLDGIDIKNKTMANMGCGTGRQWPEKIWKQPRR